MRLAVVGHAEHVTLGRVPALPGAGDIAHLAAPRSFVGGGGGATFYQLVRSPAEVLLFTAVGDDDAGRFVREELARTGARVFAAARGEAHTRDVVMVTPDGQRTIVVVGEPLQPARGDALPWELLASCDAAYFTAQDPDALRATRDARILVVTSRRRAVLIASRVHADVVVGSLGDPRERCTLADFPSPPAALVLTDGARGGQVETAAGISRWEPSPPPETIRGSYGAGDSFAGALVYFLALGLEPVAAAKHAAAYGAAVLGGLTPQDCQLVLAPPRQRIIVD
jgi:ribokinase